MHDASRHHIALLLLEYARQCVSLWSRKIKVYYQAAFLAKATSYRTICVIYWILSLSSWLLCGCGSKSEMSMQSDSRNSLETLQTREPICLINYREFHRKSWMNLSSICMQMQMSCTLGCAELIRTHSHGAFLLDQNRKCAIFKRLKCLHRYACRMRNILF